MLFKLYLFIKNEKNKFHFFKYYSLDKLKKFFKNTFCCVFSKHKIFIFFFLLFLFVRKKKRRKKKIKKIKTFKVLYFEHIKKFFYIKKEHVLSIKNSLNFFSQKC